MRDSTSRILSCRVQASKRSSSPQACAAATSAPIDVPQTMSGRMPACTRVLTTPRCAHPRAEPLPSARPMRGLRLRRFTAMSPQSVPAAAAPGHRIAARAEHHEGQRRHEEHGLKFKLPTARARELAKMTHVREKYGHQHVDGDECGRHARPDAGYEQNGREHFANIHAPGKKTRQPLHGEHGFNATDTRANLGPPVQKYQYAQHKAQNQSGEFVERVLRHGCGLEVAMSRL